MDDARMPQRLERARVISFESFLRRTSGLRLAPDRDEAESPFGQCQPLRPLNQRQISHRLAMLKHMGADR